LGIGILVTVMTVSLYFVMQSESSKITTFEECEKSWLVRSITFYDYPEYVRDTIQKECTLWSGKSFAKQTEEPPLAPPPTTKPESLPLTTKGYVYDAKLSYGFEYPDGWEFFINMDKDVEQCDPTLDYEAYTCVDFPDKNIKKVITFIKKLSPISSLPPPQIDFTVKSAANLQEVTNEFKKEVKVSGVPILSEKAILINNVSGYDTFAGTSDWKLRQTVFFINGTAYVFKYSSQEKFYRTYEETFNKIINSFKIK